MKSCDKIACSMQGLRIKCSENSQSASLRMELSETGLLLSFETKQKAYKQGLEFGKSFKWIIY